MSHVQLGVEGWRVSNEKALHMEANGEDGS